MYQQIYYLDKSTQTLADELAAYGLATLFSHIVKKIPAMQESDIFLRDEGNCYAVVLSQPLQADWIEQQTFFSLVRYIQKAEKAAKEGDKVKAKKAALPEGLEWVEYEAERLKKERWFEARKNLPKAALRPTATRDKYPELEAIYQQYEEPDPDLDIWGAVNQMSAITTYNNMVLAWYEARVCFPELLKIILQLTATPFNDVVGATQAWQKLAKQYHLTADMWQTATQVYNPATGKGANRPKADSLTIGGQDNFWLIEWLKAIGMTQAGLPRVVSKAKDRKTYVLIPKNINLGTNKTIFSTFRHQFWPSSAIKMDIMASLHYTRIFLEQWRARQLDDFDLEFGGLQPGDYVQGLAVAFYKDMGSAFALMNQSVINLPNWLKEVKSKEEVTLFLAMLEEHEKVISVFEEKKGDDNHLLHAYRDFLSGGDLQDFFEFTSSYSSYLTNKIEKKEYVSQFTVPNLEALMKGKESQDKPLSAILATEGFKNVARAIRESTVNAQWAKLRDQRLYDVRYGLGNELKRKANYPTEFVQALSDFMHSYNQENVQMAERYKSALPRRRSQITTHDIAEVVALIDSYDAKTVANLLVAFGYASDSTKKEDNKINPDNQPTGDLNDE